MTGLEVMLFNLRKLVKEKKLNQKIIAEKLKLSRQQVSNILNGESFTAESLKRVEKFIEEYKG